MHALYNSVENETAILTHSRLTQEQLHAAIDRVMASLHSLKTPETSAELAALSHAENNIDAALGVYADRFSAARLYDALNLVRDRIDPERFARM